MDKRWTPQAVQNLYASEIERLYGQQMPEDQRERYIEMLRAMAQTAQDDPRWGPQEPIYDQQAQEMIGNAAKGAFSPAQSEQERMEMERRRRMQQQGWPR